MTRLEIARDLDKLSTVLGMAVAALERLADDLRRPDEPEAPEAPAAPEETEA